MGNAKGVVLTALSLPENPDDLLAKNARILDQDYRDVGGRRDNEARAVSEQGPGLVDQGTCAVRRPLAATLAWFQN